MLKFVQYIDDIMDGKDIPVEQRWRIELGYYRALSERLYEDLTPKKRKQYDELYSQLNLFTEK